MALTPEQKQNHKEKVPGRGFQLDQTKLDGLTLSDRWKPTEKQLKFAEEYARTGKAAEAYRTAYPDCNFSSQEAYKLLRRPQIRALVEQIQQDMRARFVLISPEAQAQLEDLAKNAKSEAVRLQANLEILDRAGLDSPKKVELSGLGIFGEAKPEDIRDAIKSKCEATTPTDSNTEVPT